MQSSTLSVTELNEYVRRSLAGDPILQGIAIHGEISNFKRHISGHLYFSLKDASSRIACVMFRQHAQMLRFSPQDGMKVILSGSVGLYTASGNYQFYCEAMAADGTGALYEQYLLLKDRLQKEGLFDASLKMPLPLLPKGIGIVTAKSGAVLHDIKQVAARRFPGVMLILRPSAVQGEGAANELAQGIRDLELLPEVEVIIIGRGGGSLEDLWAFNEEVLVRTIAACKKPVVSAVGHETDVTLTDFAADVRAATPSVAAELVVPSKSELQRRIDSITKRLSTQAEHVMVRKTTLLEQNKEKLQQNNPELQMQTLSFKQEALSNRLHSSAAALFEIIKSSSITHIQRFDSAGPQKTLQRGYAIVLDDKNKPVQSIKKVTKHMTLHFQDGYVKVQTLEKKGW